MSDDLVKSNNEGITSPSSSIKCGIAASARCSSPLVKSSSKLLRVATLLRGRRNRKFAFGRIDPLVAFVDQHHGNIVHDGIFAPAILADEPGIFIVFELAASRAHTVGTAQDFDQSLTNHVLSVS